MSKKIVWETCLDCNGTGEKYLGPAECPRCHGTQIEKIAFGLFGESVCSKCGGTGKYGYYYETCSGCNGRGKVRSIIEDQDQLPGVRP